MEESVLVLASSSPRRQELIRTLGLPVRIMPSMAEETTDPAWTPAEIVERLALRKAEEVHKRLSQGTEGWVIGSDTIVVKDGVVYGKPTDSADAKRMLHSLQGQMHQVYSGIAIIAANAAGECSNPDVSGISAEPLGDVGEYRTLWKFPDGRPGILSGHTVSRVFFRKMREEEIQGYVHTGDPLDKAGAYGVQGIGSFFIEKIEGDFYSIMGLPLNLLYQMLLQFGVQPISARGTSK